MNAIQPQRPTLQPLEPRRMVPRTQPRQRRHPYRAVAGETTAKLVVNLVLCAAAITGLVQLLPYHLSQQAKLREVRSEVKRAEERVKNLRTDFSHSFDSGQAQSIMQEQSYLVDPTKRQVVWQDRGIKDEN
ncbi:MAG: hypothetical protein ICV55_06830 [Coleofasciculus sp. C3-bin4]|nr:hypothetical protein [Coleofasciculus sp. C3-bin4]